MGAKRLPRQIRKVVAGDRLSFIRGAFDGQLWYCKSRIVEVLEVYDDIAMIAMTAPMRDIHNNRRDDLTFTHEGFRYCRYVTLELLLDNCRRER